MYLADENRYNEMKYNRVGNSGLKLPVVSLGLWHNFGATWLITMAQRPEMLKETLVRF